MVAKSLAVTARGQIFAEAQMILVDAPSVARSAPVEARNIRQHAPEPGTDEVRRLAEQAEEIGARVFDPGVIQRDGEGHVGWLCLDPESLQEFDKVGICFGIVDDEAGVDGNVALIQGNENRVRMSADPVGFLVDDDVVASAQEPCGGKTGHSGAHDGDAQTRS